SFLSYSIWPFLVAILAVPFDSFSFPALVLSYASSIYCTYASTPSTVHPAEPPGEKIRGNIGVGHGLSTPYTALDPVTYLESLPRVRRDIDASDETNLGHVPRHQDPSTQH